MFSNRIANSARFLQMPAESQLLYFHMVLRADDDGVVESYPLIKLLGMAPDNFKVLLAKSFIKQLNEDQVIVITDWLEHNVIRADRKVDSIYKNLLIEKAPDLKLIEPKPRSDVEDNSKRLGGQSTDGISQVRLGKVRLGKDSIDMSAKADAFNQFYNSYPKKELKKKTKEIWLRKNPPIKEILDFIEKAKLTDRWLKGYIKSPPAFLNGECWNDDLSAYKDKNNANNKPNNKIESPDEKYKKYD